MARFPTENQFWKLRSKSGRDTLFATPEKLLEAAEEYFNWVDAHPFYKAEPIKSGELAGTLMKAPVPRPYTLEGFLIYIDAGKEYWRDFKRAKHADFSGVIERIENIMYNNKFSGAASGFFNPSLIARDVGLRDNLGLSDPDGNPLQSAPAMIIVQPGNSGDLEIKESE